MVYSDEIEDKIDQIIPVLTQKYPDLKNPRWHAIKLLEGGRKSQKTIPR